MSKRSKRLLIALALFYLSAVIIGYQLPRLLDPLAVRNVRYLDGWPYNSAGLPMTRWQIFCKNVRDSLVADPD